MRVAFLGCWITALLTATLFLMIPLPASADPLDQQPDFSETRDSTQAPSDSSAQAERQASEPDFERLHREMTEEQLMEFGPRADEYIAYLSLTYACPRMFAPGERIIGLGKSGRIDGLPVLQKVLLHNPKPGYRTDAITAIACLENYTGDRTALPTLRNALADSVTEVQWETAKALLLLGDTTSALPMVFRIAKGEDKENWSADWGYRMGLEFMTVEQASKARGRRRDAFQCEAIRRLGRLGTPEAVATLRDLQSRYGKIRPDNPDLSLASCVRGALSRAGQVSPTAGTVVGGGR